jgi:hypothetical protein
LVDLSLLFATAALYPLYLKKANLTFMHAASLKLLQIVFLFLPVATWITTLTSPKACKILQQLLQNFIVTTSRDLKDDWPNVLMPGAIGSASSKTGRKHQQQGWEGGL